MSKTKEIFATNANQITHNARDKQFKEYKKQLAERINKAANEGEFYLHLNIFSIAGRWEELKSWLESIGFVVSSNGLSAVVKWDDNSLARKAITAEPTKASHIEFDWIFDPHPYDYVCSCCNEHSEYTSNYCPHCGAKMCVPNGGKRRDY